MGNIRETIGKQKTIENIRKIIGNIRKYYKYNRKPKEPNWKPNGNAIESLRKIRET